MDLVIVDRSFANLYDVVYYKFLGYAVILLLKFATGGYRSYNDINFYMMGAESEKRTKAVEELTGKLKPMPSDQESNQHLMNFNSNSNNLYGKQEFKYCYKVLTCDVNDEIVHLQSSLMVGVAR